MRILHVDIERRWPASPPLTKSHSFEGLYIRSHFLHPCSVSDCTSLTSSVRHPQRQRLIRNRSPGDSSGSGAGDTSGQDGSATEGVPWGLENGGTLESETQPLEEPSPKGPGGGIERIANTEDTQPKDDEEDEDEDADEEQHFRPLTVPGGWTLEVWKVWKLIQWCIVALCERFMEWSTQIYNVHFKCVINNSLIQEKTLLISAMRSEKMEQNINVSAKAFR